MKKLHLLALAAVALLAAPVPSFAHHWTSVCSTGAIDDADLNQYAVGTASLSFFSGVTGTITARYNVTNTSQNVNIPPWTTLQMGYLDNSASSAITATLYQVSRCTGTVTSIASVTSTDSASIHCSSDTFPANTINFGVNNYVIVVVMTRSVTTVFPAAYTLTLD